ncbi:MAG: hypothetical protein ACYTBV_04920 [Planctomycetota bacterium]
MDQTRLILKAYYEALYELLLENRELLIQKAEILLAAEIKNAHFELSQEHKFNSYLDACQAFIDERIETYNPIGIQYAFDRSGTKEALELQLQLDWYNSQSEFLELLEAAKEKVLPDMSDQILHQLAQELIKERGAYPDKSIIAEYSAAPALQKLPDFIVAAAIEQIIESL